MDTYSKALLALIIGIALLFPAIGFPLDLEPGQVVEVTVDGLNLREGVGIPAKIIRTVSKSYRLKILRRSETNRNWYEVSCHDGTTGWIGIEARMAGTNLNTVALARTDKRSVSPPTYDRIKILIRPSPKLSNQLEKTRKYKEILTQIRSHGRIDMLVSWKFKGQRGDFKNQTGKVQIETDARIVDGETVSYLSMPKEEFFLLLKAGEVSAEINVYDFHDESLWFILSQKDYTILVDWTDIAHQLKGLPSTAKEDQGKRAQLQLDHSTLKLEHAILASEKGRLLTANQELQDQLEKLEEQIDLLKKRSVYDAGTESLKALREDTEETSNNLIQVRRQLEETQIELAKVETERDNLREQLVELVEKDSQRIMQSLPGPKTDTLAVGTPSPFQPQLTGGLFPFLKEEDESLIWQFPLPHSDRQIEFVYVEAGRFPMGLSETEVNDVIKQSQNPLYSQEQIRTDRQWQRFEDSFLIGRYEVTHQEYQTLVPSHRYAPTQGRQPVTNLSERDILSFCRLLDAAYPEFDIGLPTEREWEYAARGASGSKYTWGNQFDKDQANLASEQLMKVGLYPASDSWCRVSDMIGNAAEVCIIDTHSYVKEPEAFHRFVARGGSYESNQYSSRTTSRHLLLTPKANQIGFRIVIRFKK